MKMFYSILVLTILKNASGYDADFPEIDQDHFPEVYYPTYQYKSSDAVDTTNKSSFNVVKDEGESTNVSPVTTIEAVKPVNDHGDTPVEKDTATEINEQNGQVASAGDNNFDYDRNITDCSEHATASNKTAEFGEDQIPKPMLLDDASSNN